MKINWIKYEDLQTGLKINKVEFFDDVSLLVGISGVGKTQILSAIMYARSIILDKNVELKPCKMEISVDINSSNYQWSFEINKSTDSMFIENQTEFRFVNEKLTKNSTAIFNRDGNNTDIIGYNKVPIANDSDSILVQYASLNILREFIMGMRKIFSVNAEASIRRSFSEEAFDKYVHLVKRTLELEKDSNPYTFSTLPTMIRLFVIKNYFPKLYREILEVVTEVFSEIEDLEISRNKDGFYSFTMTVYGKRLPINAVSTGMLKTIDYVLELFTVPKNSVILIDEFENGLGVNCIDTLEEIMLSDRNDLQFIITSHHPRIINQIPKENWKIIDRNIDTVSNKSSVEYGIGNSQHDAYFNLVNRWEYEGKI